MYFRTSWRDFAGTDNDILVMSKSAGVGRMLSGLFRSIVKASRNAKASRADKLFWGKVNQVANSRYVPVDVANPPSNIRKFVEGRLSGIDQANRDAFAAGKMAVTPGRAMELSKATGIPASEIYKGTRMAENPDAYNWMAKRLGIDNIAQYGTGSRVSDAAESIRGLDRIAIQTNGKRFPGTEMYTMTLNSMAGNPRGIQADLFNPRKTPMTTVGPWDVLHNDPARSFRDKLEFSPINRIRQHKEDGKWVYEYAYGAPRAHLVPGL